MKKISYLIIFIISFFISCFILNAKELSDGTYIISSGINTRYSLDIPSGNNSNNVGIQLYQTNWTNAQKWNIKKESDGYYSIISFSNNNYSLDVDCANYNNGTRIQLYKSNSTKAQRWKLKDAGNGYYYIVSSNNKYVMDVNSGQVFNGNIIQLYELNNTKAQQFLFTKIETGTQTIEDGIYTISSSLDEKMLIESSSGQVVNNANVQLYTSNNTEAQKWKISYIGNGLYKILLFKNTNLSLDVDSAGKTNTTNLQLYSYNGTPAQEWIIKSTDDGYYNIISYCNNLAVDVSSGQAFNGANVWLYEQNGTNAQKFIFNKIENIGSRTIEDGYYFIASSINRNKNFDVTNGIMTNGNNVQIYDSNSTLAQKWHIKYIDNGYYEILSNKNEDYALTVDSLEQKDMIGVNINNNTHSDSQKWVIKDNYDGTYSFIAKNYKYIDLNSGNISNGTKIWMYEGNNTKAQKFKLLKTAEGTGISSLQNGIYIIESSLDTNKVLDVPSGNAVNGNELQLYDLNGSYAQKWQFSYVGNGIYKIVSLKDLTKSLDVANGSVNSGSSLNVYDYNGTYAQQWLLKEAGDGYYYIISNSGGLVLDVCGANTTNGTKVWMYKFNNTLAQKWKIRKVQEKNQVIDVSAHQGTIDWDKVYNSGIYGVILRIGYWNTEDSRFYEYIKEIKRLGIPYGIYLFSYANTTNGASIEANFTNSIISKYDLNPTLGIYYDLEDWYLSADNTSNTLSKEQYDDIARTYINTVSKYVGSKYKVKIYADLNHVTNKFGDYARNESDWIAQYNNTGCTYTGRYSMWQYTSEAILDGIRGYVDMSILY